MYRQEYDINMNPGINYKRLVPPAVVLAVIIIALMLTRSVMFGGARPISLTAADPLVGRISQALATGNSTELAVPGRDYTLKNTTYFEDKTWVVTTIAPVGGSSYSGMVVLHKSDKVYDVVLGPGTAFSSTELGTLPNNIVLYIKAHGVVYDPVI